MNHGSSASEDRIVVGWAPPERVDGKLLGYKLYWCEVREDSDSSAEPEQAYDYFEVRLGKDATMFAAENLVPGQDYRFQILACESPHPLPYHGRPSAYNPVYGPLRRDGILTADAVFYRPSSDDGLVVSCVES